MQNSISTFCHIAAYSFFCFYQDMVEALTTQNSELRAMLIKATETRTYNPDSSVENAQREDVVSIMH